MVGTFALVFAGCGAIAVDAQTGGSISHVGVSLTLGQVIMVMVNATGHVSGAHLNPAVTVGFAVARRFPRGKVAPYITAQVVAGLAALALRGLFGGADLGVTRPALGAPVAVGLEVALTFFLMFVIMAVATDSRAAGSQAGWAIGGTVALASLFGGPISGASMNPARSIGPALASGAADALWIYLLAPVAGAIVGALAYSAIAHGQELSNATGRD